MKTVIEMARGVKATAYTNRHYPDRTTYTFGPEQLEAFAELVRADEREACAKVCKQQSLLQLDERVMRGIDACTDAIRARSNT